MPDYKEMYLTLFRATEQAINTLVAAQQACEERYINGQDGEVTLLPRREQPSGEKDARKLNVEGIS
ncbi:hypothetical protein ACTQ4E_12025 [Lawsonibacter sp. LCP25S3_G6]|uniref:hypothetical protein n=1 Tax=unclassified Lawsonibacter TaxID=2617946 RepID=UPI003F98CEC8